MALITIIGLILFISITCIFIGWRFKMDNMMLGGIVVTLVVMVVSIMIIVDNGVKIWQLLSQLDYVVQSYGEQLGSLCL